MKKIIIGYGDYNNSWKEVECLNTDQYLESIEMQLATSIRYAEADLEAANESNYKTDATDAKHRIKNLKIALELVKNSHKLS